MIEKNKILYAHEAAEQLWLQAFKDNKLHHAWLICGDKGIGKATFAHKIAKFMLSNPVPLSMNLNVEFNHPAALRVVSKSHPDFFLLESEMLEEGELIKADIKVDDIRKLTKFLSLTPVISKYKIAIIDAIDALNINAANALLKFLEEPFANTYFLLVCNSLGNILPTIRSRCRLINLKKPDVANFFKALKGCHNKITIEEAEHLYNITNGSLYYSNLLLRNDIKKLLNEVEDLFVANAPLDSILKLAKKITTDSLFEAFVYIVLNLLQNKIQYLAITNTTNLEKEIDKFDKIRDLIQIGNNLNLDRNYVAQKTLYYLQN